MTVVVAYDISNDSRRSRVAARIQIWGDRIQESVYVCRLDADELLELESQMSKIIDPDRDSIYVMAQCQSCWGQIKVLGQAHKPEPVVTWTVL